MHHHVSSEWEGGFAHGPVKASSQSGDVDGKGDLPTDLTPRMRRIFYNEAGQATRCLRSL